MNSFSSLLVIGFATWIGATSPAQAQDRIFRCPGNEYTNNVQDAKARGCKPMDGGNITVVQSPPSQKKAASAARPAASSNKSDSAAQKDRDADARAILQDELQKAKAKQAELEAAYANGQPDKIGGEARNYQKYLDRVADMKAALDRNTQDIAGIQREIDRLPPAQ